jgi:hypothetical protein
MSFSELDLFRPRPFPPLPAELFLFAAAAFKTESTAGINGKTANVTFKDSNRLSVGLPALVIGAQQFTLSNPDGETVSLDAAYTAN